MKSTKPIRICQDQRCLVLPILGLVQYIAATVSKYICLRDRKIRYKIHLKIKA